MKTLIDTSVLVAALVESHPMHERALPWLTRGKGGAFPFFVAAHSLAETYSVLTRLPVRPAIGPEMALRLIQDNVTSAATIVPLSAKDYEEVLVGLARLGLAGGIVYVALIAKAAQKAGAERLLTFNQDHFRRAWPEGAGRIRTP